MWLIRKKNGPREWEQLYIRTCERSNHNGLISSRASLSMICCSSVDVTVTKTIYPRFSRSQAIDLVMGSWGEPDITVFMISNSTGYLIGKH